MNHEAQVIVKNKNAVFSNASIDNFANGVELKENGHTAKMWIDDTDADVAIKGVTDKGEFKISIGTNGEYGMGPYLTIEGESYQGTSITDFEGVISIIPV